MRSKDPDWNKDGDNIKYMTIDLEEGHDVRMTTVDVSTRTWNRLFYIYYLWMYRCNPSDRFATYRDKYDIPYVTSRRHCNKYSTSIQ